MRTQHPESMGCAACGVAAFALGSSSITTRAAVAPPVPPPPPRTRLPPPALTRSRSYSSSNVLRAVGGTQEPAQGPVPPSTSSSPSPGERDDDGPAALFRETLRRLAELSLADYEWRSGVFKATEADRMVETSVARMRGQDPAYVRPMDAGGELGPLGRWEKAVVEWLASVLEEEGRRAKTIVDAQGRLVRPIEGEVLGPLGFLEKAVVDFLNKIRTSERERVRTHTLRPKDLAAESRGPLGELEEEAVALLRQIEQSETLRAQQSRTRGGEIVRPIDVPGPLGDFEMAVSELFQAEKLRSRERQQRGGQVVRPKDAKYRGPLGDAELQAYETIKQLNQEELSRLENIQKFLQEHRPMETNRDSILGVLETILVGLWRAPQMLASVFDRVKELMSSEGLSEDDQQRLAQKSVEGRRGLGLGPDDSSRSERAT